MKTGFIFSGMAFLFLFSGKVCIAQETRRWALGVSYSADLPYERRGEKAPFALGYSTGLNVNYKLSKHFALQSGCLVENKVSTSYDYDDFSNFRSIDVSPLTGYLETFRTTRDYYLTIPVKVYVMTGGKRLRLFASTGLNLNIPLRHTSHIISKSSAGSVERHSSDHIGSPPLGYASGSVGLEVYVLKRWFVRTEPTFLMHHRAEGSAPFSESRFYTFGLNLSVFMKL